MEWKEITEKENGDEGPVEKQVKHEERVSIPEVGEKMGEDEEARDGKRCCQCSRLGPRLTVTLKFDRRSKFVKRHMHAHDRATDRADSAARPRVARTERE
ncbi:unnamed protein product [Pleuronectes platessa]|uniref:Uncharacterized protein n=1 Tax=Pleuronectes platessa TaxID=8262 RepID=A0A9N7VBC6_PLEPL|nr:unnamed protein product [Pleuronectes platessa]